MADVNSILGRLIASLTISDPTWDVSVGSATYKILESVASEIAIAANNSTLQTYSFNVNSKAGTDLDAFVNLFGMSRQLGKRSTGVVTFTISSPSTTVINIPAGTQVFAAGTSTSTGVNVYFSTSTPTNIGVGQTQVQVPVVATLTGSNGNVLIGTIENVLTPLVGLPTVTNYAQLTGGVDTETDSQLQARWSATAFSNISGVVDKFVSMALQDPNVSRVNVVGAQQSYTEQLQVRTLISGTGNLVLGLNAQAQFAVASGATTATLLYGSLPPYNTITSGFLTPSVSGILPGNGTTVVSGSLFYDGTNYKLSSTVATWSGATVSGILNMNYTLYSSIISGTTTSSGVLTTVSGLLATLSFNGNTFVQASGTTVASGIYIVTNTSTGYNVVASGATATAVNSITSQIPDSKYSYPQGSETIGVNLNSSSEVLFDNNIDYFYPSSPTVPLKIPLNPTVGNSPAMYTGSLLGLQSQYIPISSRITDPTINSNYVDVFIDSTNAFSVTEQVIISSGILFTAASGQLCSSNFVFADGTTCASGVNANQGDYYIGVSQKPLVNFPAQLISGNAPSFVTFGAYNLPVALEYVQYTVSGHAPILTVSGATGSNILYTTTSLSGLCVGLVVSGNNIPQVPFGTYITSLTPGNPNQIGISTTLSGNFSGSVAWVTIAYPVYDVTGTAGSTQDLTAIGIDSSNYAGYPGPPFNNGTGPAQLTSMVGTFTHSYNSDVTQVSDLEQQSRVVGTNVLVHQAQLLNLIINLSVVYQNGVNIQTVNNNIQVALVQYFNGLTYNQTVSFSDISSIVISVQGVSSARITTSTDNPSSYGIQTVNIDGSIIKTYTTSVPIANNQLPSIYKINTIGFGVNNF